MAIAKNKAKLGGSIVEVKMVNPKKTGTITLRDYTDKNGVLRQLKNANGDSIVVKYTRAMKVLNLENKTDFLEYEHLRNHPLYVNGSKPLIKLINKVEEAENNIEKKERGIDAMMVARELISDKLSDFARILGINTNNVSEKVIKSQLYNIAEEEPLRFMESWEDPNRLFKEIAHKGLQRKLFTVKKTGAWYYREVLMGSNIDEVIIWFKENEDLVPGIKKELNKSK